MTPIKKTALVISMYARAPTKRPTIFDDMVAQGFSFEVYSLGTEKALSVVIKSLFLIWPIRRYDMIITSDYASSFAINMRLRLTRSKIKHVTIGLNQSRRLFRTGLNLVDRFINGVFQRTDLVVVHSRREASLFAQIHGIATDRFYFSLWGYDLPQTASTLFSDWRRPYVCLVGRNNRDIDTFVAAIDGMAIDGIVITSQHNAIANALPSNVHFYVDMSLDDTLSCIKYAAANAILLKDDERGAGHITAVTGMLYGVPHIISEAEVLKDYLIDGVSAIAVARGDVEAVRAAIDRLTKDIPFAARLSTNAQNYALRWLTNRSASERITRALIKLMDGQQLEPVDRDWLREYQSLTESA